MAQFGWDKIDEYHDGYGFVPKEKAQWFRGPEWPDCPSTYEVERHEAKCSVCKKELYFQAGTQETFYRIFQTPPGNPQDKPVLETRTPELIDIIDIICH